MIPIFRDNKLCYSCSYNVVNNKAHFVLEFPLYNPIKDEFPSLFENVVLGSLEIFFQSDHQDDMSSISWRLPASRRCNELHQIWYFSVI